MNNDIKKLKGLIFQHNPISAKTANGKTLSVFFKNFTAENLAQIYVTPIKTDDSLCCNHYHISESVMIKRFLRKPAAMTGKAPSLPEARSESASLPNRLQTLLSGAFFRKYITIFRDYIWEKRYWDNKTFWDWIDNFAPDFLFFSAGNIAAEYEMAMEICSRKRIPLIIHVGDDYFTYDIKFPFLIKKYQKRMTSCFKKLYESSSGVVAICGAMRDTVLKRFGGSADKFIIAMNAINTSIRYEPFRMHEGVQKIVYMGNLGLNRLDTLYAVSIALNIINKKENSYEIDVYSNTLPSRKELKRFSRLGNCYFLGKAQASDLFHIRQSADILLHVESFKASRRRILETGFSTKTPEIMYAGRPVLMVGPSYSAVIRYIKDNEYGMAITCKEPSEMAKQMVQVFDQETFMGYIARAQQAALENYDEDKTAARVYQLIDKAVTQSKMKELLYNED